MTCKIKDVVLVQFVFSDGSGIKKRPALVVSGNSYNTKRQEIIIAAITSNIKRILIGDTKVSAWEEAGLLKPSIVTAIIQTIKRELIIKRLGSLSLEDFKNVQNNMRESFDI